MLGCFRYLRVAGNAAYIIGTVAETEMGCYRILGLAKGQQGDRKILADLTRMLTFDDSESVMNAAGTMGTLVCNFVCCLKHSVMTQIAMNIISQIAMSIISTLCNMSFW